MCKLKKVVMPQSQEEEKKKQKPEKQQHQTAKMRALNAARLGDGVYLAPSGALPGVDTGLGLFTSRAFKKNDYITEYDGEFINREASAKLKREGLASHVMSLGNSFMFLDGLRIPAMGRGGSSFANEAREGQTANCKFSCYVEQDALPGLDRMQGQYPSLVASYGIPSPNLPMNDALKTKVTTRVQSHRTNESLQVNHRVYLQAEKHLAKDTELFVPYGTRYQHNETNVGNKNIHGHPGTPQSLSFVQAQDTMLSETESETDTTEKKRKRRKKGEKKKKKSTLRSRVFLCMARIDHNWVTITHPVQPWGHHTGGQGYSPIYIRVDNSFLLRGSGSSSRRRELFGLMCAIVYPTISHIQIDTLYLANKARIIYSRSDQTACSKFVFDLSIPDTSNKFPVLNTAYSASQDIRHLLRADEEWQREQVAREHVERSSSSWQNNASSSSFSSSSSTSSFSPAPPASSSFPSSSSSFYNPLFVHSSRHSSPYRFGALSEGGVGVPVGGVREPRDRAVKLSIQLANEGQNEAEREQLRKVYNDSRISYEQQQTKELLQTQKQHK
jgi:hypothetical protein